MHFLCRGLNGDNVIYSLRGGRCPVWVLLARCLALPSPPPASSGFPGSAPRGLLTSTPASHRFTAWLGWGKKRFREKGRGEESPLDGAPARSRLHACSRAAPWLLSSARVQEARGQTGNPSLLCRYVGKTPRTNSRGSLL